MENYEEIDDQKSNWKFVEMLLNYLKEAIFNYT